MSQTQKILNYLKSGKKLNAIMALNKFGCFRLAARISDIKNQGVNIKSVKVVKNNKSFAEYSI
jgi:hypothetical protein